MFNFYNVMDNFVVPLMLAVGVVLLTCVCCALAAVANAEAACLEKGYPNSFVTYKFDVYCANFEGAITVKVEN